MTSRSVQFPDLVPPPGWRGFSLPPQVRLVPPGHTLESARATIIVSPIAPRHLPMPAPADLVLQAIRFEQQHRLDVVERSEPTSAPSDTGLEGVQVFVRGRERGAPAADEQRRLYVIYWDGGFLYGINFMGFGEEYDRHLDAFWKTARSVRAFSGAAVPRQPMPQHD